MSPSWSQIFCELAGNFRRRSFSFWLWSPRLTRLIHHFHCHITLPLLPLSEICFLIMFFTWYEESPPDLEWAFEGILFPVSLAEFDVKFAVGGPCAPPFRHLRLPSFLCNKPIKASTGILLCGVWGFTLSLGENHSCISYCLTRVRSRSRSPLSPSRIWSRYILYVH